ncbi:MAG: hypothetical protein ACFFDK_15310, partial [Promethearchaeota archaeon]
LITIYEQKAECGIFFKLNPEKSPLEILGVLDFLKDRIAKWGNTNFYSYYGDLFKKGPVLVVGARELEEAISIIIYMYLSNVVDYDEGINNLIERLDSTTDLEMFLRNDVSKNIEKGYSKDPNLESVIMKHLEDIIHEEKENNKLNF